MRAVSTDCAAKLQQFQRLPLPAQKGAAAGIALWRGNGTQWDWQAAPSWAQKAPKVFGSIWGHQKRKELGWEKPKEWLPPKPWSFFLCKQQHLRRRVFLIFGSDDPTYIERLEERAEHNFSAGLFIKLQMYKYVYKHKHIYTNSGLLYIVKKAIIFLLM